MRVLVTTDAVGGVWTYAIDLAQGLAARGMGVVLAVLGPAPSPPQREAAKAIPGLKLVETGLPLDWLAKDSLALAQAAGRLAALADREGVDLVHLNSPALAGEATWPCPIVGVAHSDLATWWRAVRGGEPPEDFLWRIALTARGYTACDALIAPSAAFARATAAAYGVSPFVVRNGRVPPRASAAAVRDIPMITTGRLWDDGKGMVVLDAAAEQMAAPVLALGPTYGPHGEHGVFHHLELAGARSAAEVASALARSRIFVSAACYEPFGLGVLEAAQAGCALVLSDIDTFRELWADAAVFVPRGDASGFARALSRLQTDERERGRLAAAALQRAQRYSVEAFVAGVVSVHESVLARSSVAAAITESAA